jgi:hypothetical protein
VPEQQTFATASRTLRVTADETPVEGSQVRFTLARRRAGRMRRVRCEGVVVKVDQQRRHPSCRSARCHIRWQTTTPLEEYRLQRHVMRATVA